MTGPSQSVQIGAGEEPAEPQAASQHSFFDQLRTNGPGMLQTLKNLRAHGGQWLPLLSVFKSGLYA